jgi:hypothetical protein
MIEKNTGEGCEGSAGQFKLFKPIYRGVNLSAQQNAGVQHDGAL